MASTLSLAATVNTPLNGCKAYVLDWKAHTDQTVNNSITDLTGLLAGRVVAFETIPGLNGDLTTTLPTAAYDITIVDEYGTDVAAGALADRSGTAGERVNPSVAIPIWGALTLKIAAAGDSKTGRLIIVVDETRP